MKNYFSNKALFVFVLALTAQFSAFADSKEISKAKDFVNYCGTGSRYKSYDDIILTANIELTSDITLKKNLTIRSKNGSRYTISVANARQIEIDPSYKLTLTNIVFDGINTRTGENYTGRNEGLFYLKESSDTNKIARLELQNGTTIKNITVTTTADADHAVIHAKKGSRLLIREGSEILNCHNKSAHGNGGAICCDSGNIIMSGGVIANCSAKGSGGAIRVTGARNLAEDHLGVAFRGDIFLYGGYITNNVCGAEYKEGAKCYGGGIYLGDTGPMLHVIGPAVVSNNTCITKWKKVTTGSGWYQQTTYEEEERIPDDVSTFELDERYANRLKLSGDESGLTFDEGWIGVRFPDLRGKTETEIEEELKKRSFGGVWEYFTSTHEESRQFFWNGDNRYRGWMNGNALVWTRHKIYQLPRDRTTVKDVLLAADTNFPIFIEFNDGFIMDKGALGDSHIRVPDGLNVTFDLQGHSITCNLEVANGGSVTFRDSSTNRSGRVWGYRDVVTVGEGAITKDSQAYTNAYRLEGGSYRTKPDPAWVAPGCVVVGNYCEVHQWMVARLAWETNLTSRVADVTLVPLETVDNEIRDVTYDAQANKFDIDEITYSTGDWVRNAHTNMSYHVRVLAAPAISNETSNVLEEIGPRVLYFDTAEDGVVDHNNIKMPDNQPQILPSNDANDGNAISYGREDTFIWNAMSYDLIKLIHITYRKSGAVETTNAVEQAYFRFPKAAFEATQRKTNGKLPITVVEELLGALGYNRAEGFHQKNVSDTLDKPEANGLRMWENIVTGTDTNQLLLSTATEVEGGLTLNIALTDADKQGRTDTGYTVKYDIRKSTETNGWERVGEIMDKPVFSVPLLDDGNKSVGASGFYRITTLIIPDDELSVTNEIPSTNIIGVLEVASTLANTLAAVPWVELASDPDASKAQPMKVSGYLHTAHLENDDSVQVADAGHIYRKWNWNKGQKQWSGAITVTRNAVETAPLANEHELSRNSAVWVTRDKPAAKPFFLIGQYSSEAQKLKIEAGTEANPVCTLVPNPCLTAINVNEYDWGSNPIGDNKDLIRIPNGDKAPLLVQWNGEEWGRSVNEGRKTVWKNDVMVPAGTGFWYMRCGGGFEITLPASAPAAE